MFRRLRRILMTGCVGVFACISVYIYQARDFFNPALDFVETWRLARGQDPRPLSSLSGEVVKIAPGCGLEIRGEDRKLYHLNLAGLEIPGVVERPSKEDKRWEQMVRAELEQLLKSKRVRIEVTYMSEKRAGLGLVYVDETNINAVLLEQGMARLKREYIKGLPLKTQYLLVQSEKQANRKYLGLWAQSIPAVSQMDVWLTQITIPDFRR